jgi:anti-sigma factor RsiW
MNCERLQEILYDYLDDTLSPSDKAWADKHLLGCSACRQELQREVLLARTLSDRLGQVVEKIALDTNAQQGMVRAVQRKVGNHSERRSFSFWGRLAVPVMASGLVLIGAIWIGYRFFAGQHPNSNSPVSLITSSREVAVHDSYAVPTYTFQREGDLVIDALTDDIRFMDGALLVKR